MVRWVVSNYWNGPLKNRNFLIISFPLPPMHFIPPGAALSMPPSDIVLNWILPGNQTDPEAGMNGMKIARGIALISYRNQDTYNFYQADADLNTLGPFKSESYQAYQGEKLAARFNAFSYYCLSQSMDSHQVGRGRSGISAALENIKAKTHLIGIRGDLLFTEKEQEFLAENIPGANLEMIPSLYGHDGFLLEFDAISAIVFDFLQKENPLQKSSIYSIM